MVNLLVESCSCPFHHDCDFVIVEHVCHSNPYTFLRERNAKES